MSTFRSTHTRLRSSFGMSSSSLRVAALLDVDRREDATVGELAIEVDATFAEGGGCFGAHADSWPYNTSFTATDFTHEYYEYGPPGICYSGPPKCGDGQCQPEDCGVLMLEAPNMFPGDGCEENGGNCSSDCQ